MSITSFFSVGKPGWIVRRRLVIYTLIYCAGMTTWAAGWMRVETATTIISQCFLLSTAIITGYVIANVADDHLKRKAEAGAYTPTNPNVVVQTDQTQVRG